MLSLVTLVSGISCFSQNTMVLEDSIVLINQKLFYVKGQTTAFTGIGVLRNGNGVITMKQHYVNGTVSGIHMDFYDNGSKRDSGFYLPRGMEDGKYYEWYEDGAIQTIGNYKEGAEDGTWKGFGEDGKLMYKKEYKDGNIIKDVEYDSDGKIK